MNVVRFASVLFEGLVVAYYNWYNGIIQIFISTMHEAGGDRTTVVYEWASASVFICQSHTLLDPSAWYISVHIYDSRTSRGCSDSQLLKKKNADCLI